MAGNKMLILLTLVASMAMTASAASHIVGGSAGWTIPSSSSLYSQWASSQKYAVGDTLLFNFTTGMHNVMEVPKASYDSCSSTNQIGSTLTTGPATVTLTKSGMHYFICGVTGHCSIGQKLAINVVSSASPAPKAPKSAPAPVSAVRHIVGGSTGWTIPSTSSLYSQWASSQKYAVGDTLLFNFTTGMHNVMEVPKASYDSCSSTNQIGSTLTTGPATVTLTKSGMHYFICGVTGHCSIGQKLAVNVVSSASAPVSAPASAPVSAPASAPAFAPNVVPASSPIVAPSIAPTTGLAAAGPGPSTAPKSPMADSPTSFLAPSGNKGGSLGPTSSDNENPTATARPSTDGNSASSAPVSTLGGGFLGSIVLAAFFSAAFLW